MTIGQFAHASGLTPKALRFYDEKGLLVPRSVDEVTGYRRYGPEQLRRAATIKVLREMGMSLARVGEVLDNPDRAGELLARYTAEVAAEHAARDAAIARGSAVLAAYDQPVPVASRTAPEQHWVGAVIDIDLGAVDADQDGERYNAVFGQLVQALHLADNPPVGAFWTSIRADDDGRGGQLVLCWPVAAAAGPDFTVAGLRLERGTLPEREEAFVSLRFDDERFPQSAPGTSAPHPALISLMEHLGEVGPADPEIRQVGVLDADGLPVGIDIAVTMPGRG